MKVAMMIVLLCCSAGAQQRQGRTGMKCMPDAHGQLKCEPARTMAEKVAGQAKTQAAAAVHAMPAAVPAAKPVRKHWWSWPWFGGAK